MSAATLEEMLQRFADVAGIRTRAQFAAGDILLDAVKAWGPSILSEFATVARRTRRWCEMCLAVSRAVPQDLREEFAELPWTVFRFAVAHQEDRPLREWLELAATQGLGERQLAALLRGGRLAAWSGACDCGARIRVEATDAAGETVHCPLCGAEVGVMDPVADVARAQAGGEAS